MPQYRVKANYHDMDFSMGSETYTFKAKNDEKAKKHLKKRTGDWLGWNKRDVRFDLRTLSRVVDS